MEEKYGRKIQLTVPARACLRGERPSPKPDFIKASSYLLTTALQLRRPCHYHHLRVARLFGSYVRSVRWASRLKRKEVCRRSQLDEHVWTAVEKGYVPLDVLQALMPHLAKGLGYEEQRLQGLLERAIGRPR